MHSTCVFYALRILFLRNRIDTSKKHCVYYLKTFVITIGILLYALGGFNLMYPGFDEGSVNLKFAGFGIGALKEE